MARQAADLRVKRITIRDFLELASGQINPILPVIVEEEEEEEEDRTGRRTCRSSNGRIILLFFY
jgi:hypothetical protein